MARKYGDLIKPLPQYGDLIKTLPMMKREGMPAMFAAGAQEMNGFGAEGEQERYSFDKPSVIVVPKGIFHTPMWTHDYRKPVLVMAVSLTDKHEARDEKPRLVARAAGRGPSSP